MGSGSTRIEQAMEVDDKIAHLRVVDRLLRARFPSRMSRGVVGVDADDVEFRQIPERHVLDARQLAPENKVQKLFLGVLGHVAPHTGRRLYRRAVVQRAVMASIKRGCKARDAARSSP